MGGRVARMSKKALVLGGTSGLGLSLAHSLLDRGYDEVNVLGRKAPRKARDGLFFYRYNILMDDFSILDKFHDVDALIISAGVGRVAPFEEITDIEIVNNFRVNNIGAIRTIAAFYDKITSNEDFFCAVISSIAGFLPSPLFSVYGASKAALTKFVESVNIELEKTKRINRILNVTPGRLEGTEFYGAETDVEATRLLAETIIDEMFSRSTLYIPDYETVYKNVLARYSADPKGFGLASYDYKIQSARVSSSPKLRVGYLSGTFDLFHIGHLNILRRAKEYCDYLVVGVHKDASHKGKTAFIPFDERKAIVSSIKYVDQVIESPLEDSDAYDLVKYDYLFVGSDYQGSERFLRYEKIFKDTDVEIIYLPYTLRTNSTELRRALSVLSNAGENSSL